MKKIKVKLVHEGQSIGRGVGFYGQALEVELGKMDDVEIVDINADITHYTYFKLFNADLPTFYNTKTVITIHDLTPLVLPSLYPVGIRGKLGNIFQKWRAINADALVTDSINSRDDINRLFGIDKHKIFVTPLASRDIFFEEMSTLRQNEIAKKYNLPKKFILTVAGGPNPNKNLVRLAQACDNLKTPLVIVGKGVGLDPSGVKPHPEMSDFFELVKMKNVIRLGFVSEEELLAIYKLSTLYCQASLYEGFGLPLLEAMAAKVLVVSSKISSLPEIYAKKTISFDPYNVDEIKTTLQIAMTLDSTKRRDLIEANYAKAKEFSFKKMAELTMAAYKYCLIS